MHSLAPNPGVGQQDLATANLLSRLEVPTVSSRLLELDALIQRQQREQERDQPQDSPNGATQAGCGRALGAVRKYAKSASPQRAQARPDSRIARRYALQDGARRLVSEERVAKCRRVRHGDLVHVRYNPDSKRASYSGLVTCGSVWHCAVCAAKISEGRKQELQQGIAAWEAEGGRVIMVTYTLRHEFGDDLSELLDTLTKARKSMLSGKASKELNERYGIIGRVRALELTYGRNGWHPHYHELLFVADRVDGLQLQTDLRKRWAGAVGKLGNVVNDFGCKVSYAAEGGSMGASEYVAKFGEERSWGPESELAKQTAKTGRSGRNPIDLLGSFTFDGDKNAGRLWKQYAETMKGKRQLSWSRGLKKRLGIAEVSDQELADEEKETRGALLAATLTGPEWKSILCQSLRAELLEVVEEGEGKPNAVSSWLIRLGVWVSTFGSVGRCGDG